MTDSEDKQVVDLAASFGDRFRVTREAGGETWEKWPEADRVWLLEIRGRKGLVHPYGGDTLVTVVDAEKHPLIAGKVRRLPFLTALSDGAEIRAHFPADRLTEVAEILELRKRRQVSDAERERLREIGRAHLFQEGRSHGVQSGETALELPQSAGCW